MKPSSSFDKGNISCKSINDADIDKDDEINIDLRKDNQSERQCSDYGSITQTSTSNRNLDQESNKKSENGDVQNGEIIGDQSNLPRNEETPKENETSKKEEEEEEEEEEEKDTKTTSAPTPEDIAPDGGWGWVVVGGASFALMSVDTIGQCFGIIFSSFLLEREASSLTTAWMINMFAFFFCLTGLPLGPLIHEFGWRKIAFIASFMLSGATISSAFADSVWILYFTYSLLAGVSCGMLLNVSYTIVPHYFSRRRGLASGIIMALDAGGQIVAPPLVQLLQEDYTYKGATLILGGIVLNCCVAASVFHPVEWHSKSNAQVAKRCANNMKSGETQSKHLEGNDLQETSSGIVRFFRAMLNSLKIFKSTKAVFIALSSTFFLCGYQNFMAFMPFVVQDAGYSLGDAAHCVSISAICNMVTRLTVASLTDCSWFSYRISLMLSSATLTVTLIVFSHLQDLRWMMALMCIYGFGVGSYMCLFNLVMVHYLGLDNLISMMGATMMIISISNITIGPLAGLVRDLTGSYKACIWVLAIMSFCSCLFWVFMPLAITYDKKKKRKRKEKKKKKNAITKV